MTPVLPGHGRRVVMITTNTNSIAPEAVGKALRKLSANSLKKRTTKASNDGLGLVCLGSYDMENNEISSTVLPRAPPLT